MGLLESILQSQGSQVVNQLSRSTGLAQQDTMTAMSKLLGGLSQGIKQNTSSSQGLDSLLGALKSGNHSRYLENVDEAFSANGIADGNNILGHILGSKDASRALAGQVSSETGINSSILKKMLPVVASMAMGALGQQTRSSGGALGSLLNGAMGSSSQGQGMLGAFLDADNDGSCVDDILGMAMKFLR